jgi:hypothetical protein
MSVDCGLHQLQRCARLPGKIMPQEYMNNISSFRTCNVMVHSTIYRCLVYDTDYSTVSLKPHLFKLVASSSLQGEKRTGVQQPATFSFNALSAIENGRVTGCQECLSCHIPVKLSIWYDYSTSITEASLLFNGMCMVVSI